MLVTFIAKYVTTLARSTEITSIISVVTTVLRANRFFNSRTWHSLLLIFLMKRLKVFNRQTNVGAAAYKATEFKILNQ